MSIRYKKIPMEHCYCPTGITILLPKTAQPHELNKVHRLLSLYCSYMQCKEIFDFNMLLQH